MHNYDARLPVENITLSPASGTNSGTKRPQQSRQTCNRFHFQEQSLTRDTAAATRAQSVVNIHDLQVPCVISLFHPTSQSGTMSTHREQAFHRTRGYRALLVPFPSRIIPPYSFRNCSGWGSPSRFSDCVIFYNLFPCHLIC
jgi:hypothetical protein